jgi:hypothetical protein
VGGPLEVAWPRSRCFPVFQARIFRKGDLSQTARAMFLFLLTASGLGLAARCDPAGKSKGRMPGSATLVPEHPLTRFVVALPGTSWDPHIVHR